MISAFSFIHENRTYTCQRDKGLGDQNDTWWWFTVSQDSNRYAPFPAVSRDTRASVQERIVAYYANHMAHRAMTDRERWARRNKPAASAKRK